MEISQGLKKIETQLEAASECLDQAEEGTHQIGNLIIAVATLKDAIKNLTSMVTQQHRAMDELIYRTDK